MSALGRSAEHKGPPEWKLQPNTRWLYEIDGILWPIILLDEDFADGGECNKILGKLRPAMQLGHHRSFRAMTDGLLDFDPSTAGSDSSHVDVEADSLLSLAHREALKEGADMIYWRGLLASETSSRRFESSDITQDLRLDNMGEDKQGEIIDLGDESDDIEEVGANEPIRAYTSNPDYATVLIGHNPVEPIVIPKGFVNGNRYLRECVSFRDCEGGGQAMVVSRHTFEKHNPNSFRSIALWMHSRQFRPRLTEHNRFDPPLGNEQERLIEMEKIGQVFDLAREMLIFEIFDHLYYRYAALKPWSPQALLQLVMVIWRRPHTIEDAEDRFRVDLVEIVARDYTDMVADDNGGILHDLFGSYADFSKAVFERRYALWRNENSNDMTDQQ